MIVPVHMYCLNQVADLIDTIGLRYMNIAIPIIYEIVKPEKHRY